MRLLVTAVAVAVTSCIDCREEYWLQSDGSGRAELIYHLPAAVAASHGGESGIREMLTVFLNQTPTITSSDVEVATEENRIRLRINASFKSAMDLTDVISGEAMNNLPSAATHLAGDIKADMNGRTLAFNRRITPARALPGSGFLPASQLDGHRLVYIMHLPVAPEESNATRTGDDGRTLVWDIPLNRALNEPVVTRFKMKAPIPWQFLTVIAVPISLASIGWLLRGRSGFRPRFPLGDSGPSVL